MSTKTTFKRVALVAVAALGMGVLSVAVAPMASATDVLPTSIVVGTVPTAQVGVVHSTPINVYAVYGNTADTYTLVARIISAPAGSVYAGILGNGKIADGTACNSSSKSWNDDVCYSGSGTTTVAANMDFTVATVANGVVTTSYETTTFAEIQALITDTTNGSLGGYLAGQTKTNVTLDITPDVAGTYTVLVSANQRPSAAGVTYAAGDANATYTFTTGATVSSVTLAAVTGSAAGGSTYGQIFKATIKDAAGAVSQLKSGETIALSSNATTTNFCQVVQSSWACSYGTAGATSTLDNGDFLNGVAYFGVKDATTTAVDAVVTATGSGLLSNAMTSTITASTVKATVNAGTSGSIADPLLSARPSGGHSAVAGTTPNFTVKTVPSATSHSFLVTGSVVTAHNVNVDMTDSAGFITGIVGARYSQALALAATTGAGTLSVSTPAGMLNGYTFTAAVQFTTPLNIVVTSATAAATGQTISVEPNSVIKAAYGASSALSAVLEDQFGAALPNVVVTVSTTGRNASTANTTLSTDANGRVSYTKVDAGTSATVNKQDVVTFAPAGGTSATVTINYTDSALGINLVELATPTTDDTAATGVTYSDINAGSTAGAAATTQDITATVTDVNGALLVGVPVTFTTASAGTGILSTTVTVYTGADGTATASVYGWTAGVKTYTATAGAKSATGTVAFRQGGATGTSAPLEVRTISAVATGNSIVVTAKDRFGNIVSGVALFATRTGNGTFGGGSNTNGQTTGADGTAEFLFNAGSADSVVTITASDSTTALPSLSYGQTGYLAGMNVRSTAATQTAYTAATVGTATTAETGVGASLAAAGVGVVTVAMAAGVNSADTAADAAAEATDAANAATDAANAAAEAADAATAAAQDAADAVAALSAQVASLISGLKSQLTALTNLVIKIQKKVKA
jgi:hypothetical protein